MNIKARLWFVQVLRFLTDELSACAVVSRNSLRISALCGFSMLFLLNSVSLQAQTPPADAGEFCEARVVGGDTIPTLMIRQVVIARKRQFKNKRDYWAYARMVRNLKKVYPYAVMARERLRVIDSVYNTLGSESEKRAYAYRMQKELSSEFESQMRDLTFTQGQMLFKLIDRETGRTTYSIIKYFRGGVTATFWQGVARVFGSDLRSKFDPEGEDKLLNELVLLLEEGLI